MMATKADELNAAYVFVVALMCRTQVDTLVVSIEEAEAACATLAGRNQHVHISNSDEGIRFEFVGKENSLDHDAPDENDVIH